MAVMHVAQCKVCNSKFRTLIENLNKQGMNPQKIYEYLQNLTDPIEKDLVIQEDINPSSIRRHMDKHFDIVDGAKIKIAETQQRIEQSRNDYKDGVSIVVNKVSTISHLIEQLMIKIEEVDELPGEKAKHQFTIQYANSIKGLVESLAKLTGDLKQEGAIDINFFSGEIARFAEIVLSTIKQMDKSMGLNSELEYNFAFEFKKQWELYQIRQNKILSGDLSPSDDESEKERKVNTFNEGN
jgi:hypothetical protein